VTKKLTANDQIALNIVREKKFVASIKDLHKEMPHLKYGAVNYISHKLNDEKMIILAKYYDKSAGVDKMGLFIDKETLDTHLKTLDSTAVQRGGLTQTQLSKLLTRTNLYKLFEILMGATIDDDLAQIIKDNKLGGKSAEDVLNFIQGIILDIITQSIGIDISEVKTLQDNNEDAEVFVPDV